LGICSSREQVTGAWRQFFSAFHAEAVENEGAPAVVLGDPLLVVRHLLEGRHGLAVLEDLAHFVANGLPVGGQRLEIRKWRLSRTGSSPTRDWRAMIPDMSAMSRLPVRLTARRLRFLNRFSRDGCSVWSATLDIALDLPSIAPR
jgi:hypothetical protein